MGRAKVELLIPTNTILKVLATVLIVASAMRLWPLMLLVAFAILFAVTLAPWRAKLARHLPQWAATLLIILGVVLCVGSIFLFLLPPLISQVTDIAREWPKIQADLLQSIPSTSFLRRAIQKTLSEPGFSVAGQLPKHLLTVGGFAVSGLSELVLLLTLSIYLLVEGKRGLAWILAFFEPKIRQKLHKTFHEVALVISAYVSGQLLTSLLVAAFAFGVLTLLKVPGALMLSFLAGLFDILPIIGFFLSTVPAVLLALTVSVPTALGVVAAYLFYHALENYLIVPKVYGNKLRLSALVVILSLLAGGMLAGIPGAILVLPIVASYPIIERIWLKRFLGERVVDRHMDLAHESDDSKSA